MKKILMEFSKNYPFGINTGLNLENSTNLVDLSQDCLLGFKSGLVGEGMLSEDEAKKVGRFEPGGDSWDAFHGFFIAKLVKIISAH